MCNKITISLHFMFSTVHSIFRDLIIGMIFLRFFIYQENVIVNTFTVKYNNFYILHSSKYIQKYIYSCKNDLIHINSEMFCVFLTRLLFRLWLNLTIDAGFLNGASVTAEHNKWMRSLCIRPGSFWNGEMVCVCVEHI